jgi:tetratricopeptide (TPR) repeat protein
MEGLTVPFRWALPLRAGAVDLEPVSPEAPILPTMSMLLEVDATAGFDVPAKVKVEQVLRGDEAMILKAHLSSLSPEDAERGLKTYWRQTEAWVDADKAAWRYDPTQSALVFTMTGEGKVDWDGDDKDGRSHNIEGAGFTPPDPLKRPKEQDQTVPWKTDFPNFRRWTTVIRLPPATPKWRWTYKAATVDEKLGGVAYWRHAELRDGVMRTTMSRRTYLPEITAGQAKEIGERLPKFDNNISQIYQQSDEGAVDKVSAARLEAAAGRDAERLADIATYMLMNKRYDEALRAYDKALAVDPKLRKASYGKADTLRRKGDVLGALRYLDDLARTDRDPELPLAKAYLLIVAGRTAEGLAQVDSLMPSLVGKTDLLAKAADAYLQARAYDRSAAAATAAIASSPDNVYARSVRASAYDRLGRSPEALEDSEAAIRLQPEEPGLFVNRGLILEKLGRYDQALADFDEVARISPLEFDVAGPRARVLRRLGRLDESKTAYAAWVAADKGGVALNSRCWDRALANIDLADAEADCAEAVKREPKTAHYWDSYALVALRAGRFQEAVKRYDEALALEPKLAPSLFGRGVAKRRAGDAAGGDADIQAARTIQADAGAELTQAGVTP